MKKISILFILIMCMTLLIGCEFSFNNTPVNTNNVETKDSGEKVSIKPEESTPVEKKEDASYTEVRVSSAKDIFLNVKPYTRIILTDDYYNISKIDPSAFKSENTYFEDAFDGYEFIIHDIDHFEICADKNVMPEIVTEAAHANVISLKNCKNVKLDGIIAGHAVNKGSCTGGVINLENCSDIQITNSHLYGCGIYGIIANECENIDVTNSEIYDCTYGLIDIYDSKNLSFNNCTFKNSEEFSMFDLHACKNIQFDNCTITGNECKGECSLIANWGSTKISFTKCLFENNTYEYLCSVDDDEITFNSCKGKDTNFNKRYYPDYSGLDYGEENL